MKNSQENALELVVKSSFEPDPKFQKVDTSETVRQIKLLNHDINKLVRLKRNPYPTFFKFEKPELQIDKERGRLEQIKYGLEKELKKISYELSRHNKHVLMKKKGYGKQIPPEFLSAIRPDGFPTFLIIDPDSDGVFRIVRNQHTFWIEPKLPRMLESQFYQASRKLGTKLKNDYAHRSEISISAEITSGGFVPQKAREAILKAQRSRLFDNIYFVAEANEWKVNVVTRAKDDPLVLGWVEETQQLFLIALYYPTPREQYVVDQFGVTVPEEEE